MPHIFLAKNYMRVDAARRAGFTTCSLQGSSRSAKTYSVVQWLCMLCHEQGGMTVSIIRAGMPSIKRTVYRDFKDVMIAFGWWNDRSMNKSEFVYTFDNGSWIEFFSTDNEQKVRGSKRKILFVNEANELSFIEWQQLQMRTTEFSILDYNPSFSEEHWINQVNEEKSGLPSVRQCPQKKRVRIGNPDTLSCLFLKQNYFLKKSFTASLGTIRSSKT